MNREDIVRMAKEAGAIHIHGNPKEFALAGNKEIERFAELVVSAEREACAKFIEHDYVRQFERPWRDDLSAAIRARGQA